MNAAWLGNLNLGPKAHPGDGLLDVTDGKVPPGQLLTARSRARVGTHVPHPGLKVQRVPAVQCSFAKPIAVRLDGRRVGAFRDLSIRVEPDALTVVV
jgi:diacylglycerol kinase family enzyme